MLHIYSEKKGVRGKNRSWVLDRHEDYLRSIIFKVKFVSDFDLR